MHRSAPGSHENLDASTVTSRPIPDTAIIPRLAQIMLSPTSVCTSPLSHASLQLSSISRPNVSSENISLTLLFAASTISFRREGGSIISSSSAVAHELTSGGRSRPVCGSRTVSSGPPVFVASTGKPHAPASTGTMPKCSFDGVYKRQRVWDEVRRYVRWALVKLRRKRTWVLSGGAALEPSEETV